MARKLPWSATEAYDDGKAHARRATSTVPKKRAEHVSRPITPEQTPHRPHKRAKSRSPSTSPIRPPTEPIPNIEPMQEGFHADDKYMMVEDEFEAMARQFTAHLHAAEYTRLKRKAKEAPPKALPEISSNMSRTSKQNLERRHLISRQSTMLSNLGGREGVTARSGDPSSDGEDLDQGDKKVDDPWLGTSLAGLMDQGSQAKTSLMGLERMNSSTRAARGYGRGETESTPKKKRKTILDIFGETDRDDDDLRSPELVRAQSSEPRTHTSKSRNEKSRLASDKPTASKPVMPASIHSSRSPAHRSTDTSIKTEPDQGSETYVQTETSTARSTARRKRIQNLDNFDATKFETPPPLPSPSRARPSAAVPRKTDTKKDRKARLDEVPVFLA